ncbi:ATP-binding protein [Clostridium botulinum]|uniref:YifB family Mg chelatase-like AAA ATPase n=1 Tax=Clostridium TaxID=1485 RepID=UPI0013FC5E36|nr:YifB family Mg chelatase-like AAA ATPase [Clostridium botulinum]MCS6103249.1 ATP-binding protein [Clostridium botulinum]MCS6106732.1 ATP-binding protein [Clostridium botulinum]MCS6130626.1 ATP-binding protein [Clostridium botulinum]NFL44484.1 ATP-binding protein [Clostridium botulinum]NFL88929.1 ATP-binding protein [Clostridium botulinum]
MATVVNSFGILGIDGYLVKIEIDIIDGLPSISIVGMGDTAIKESRERLEASIINSKFQFPKMKIVVNLSPSDIKKRGSHYDLGMAVALLIQSKQVQVKEISTYGFIGELSLNGDLRPCTGILPMIIEAKNNGIKNIVVPMENVEEASLVSDMNIFAFKKLKEVTNFISGINPYKPINLNNTKHKISNKYLVDFMDVQGQDSAIEFIMVAAAGGHNLLMCGTPGCGKSMIAKRIPTILPSMSEEEALEVTKIYSVSGLLQNRGALITERPFRSPHHNASLNSLIGGGTFAMPGEISLSHNGVLFLDEIAEFNKKTLDALRQPIEDGKVTISRVKYTHDFPADFMLVAAMNPCPCGYYGEQRCKCTDYEIIKYRQKLSGPIMDRIDIQKNFNAVNIMDLSNNTPGPSSKSLREKVESARNIQRARYKNYKNVHCNAVMPPDLIKKYCILDNDSKKILKDSYEKFRYSARTYHKFLRVARTFADMEGSEKINKSHIIKALMCREIEKEQASMLIV